MFLQHLAFNCFGEGVLSQTPKLLASVASAVILLFLTKIKNKKTTGMPALRKIIHNLPLAPRACCMIVGVIRYGCTSYVLYKCMRCIIVCVVCAV